MNCGFKWKVYINIVYKWRKNTLCIIKKKVSVHILVSIFSISVYLSSQIGLYVFIIIILIIDLNVIAHDLTVIVQFGSTSQ